MLNINLKKHKTIGVDIAGVYAVVSLNGRYPQVTLIDSGLASGNSSHTTVVVQDDQSPVTSLSHQQSMSLSSLLCGPRMQEVY